MLRPKTLFPLPIHPSRKTAAKRLAARRQHRQTQAEQSQSAGNRVEGVELNYKDSFAGSYAGG